MQKFVYTYVRIYMRFLDTLTSNVPCPYAYTVCIYVRNEFVNDDCNS